MPSTLSGQALGLMSGTSLDGIDAALLETDGERIFSFGETFHHPYSPQLKEDLRQAMQTPSADAESWAGEQITKAHLEVIKKIIPHHKVSLIGFHGQTIFHAPEQGITKQIGSPAAIAAQTGIDVVGDFRSNDMKAGGQGAPLAPLYHLALVKKMRIEQPVAIVNIGGVANVTYIDESKGDFLAFDTGPGNGLMDDWIHRHLGLPFDEDGKVAAKGTANESALAGFMGLPYFAAPPPKSLDRHSFSLERVLGLPMEEGAATLCAWTARSIAASTRWVPTEPKCWIICGGGRHNKTLLSLLIALLPNAVVEAEKVGWQGDMLEAQCFAFLALRSVRGLPLTLPSITGCKEPTTGGVFFAGRGGAD